MSQSWIIGIELLVRSVLFESAELFFSCREIYFNVLKTSSVTFVGVSISGMPIVLVSYCCWATSHKLSGLKQHNFIILQFWLSRNQHSLTGLKWRCGQCWGVCFPCLFQLLESTHSPWLIAPSSSFKSSSGLLSLSHFTSLWHQCCLHLHF